MTDSGRTVYGGGGITPDEKIDSPKSNQFQDVCSAPTKERLLPLRRRTTLPIARSTRIFRSTMQS